MAPLTIVNFPLKIIDLARLLVISPYCGFHLLLIKMHLSNSLSLLKVTNNAKFDQFIKFFTLMILMMTLMTLRTLTTLTTLITLMILFILLLNDYHNDGRKVQNLNP